jgi:TonB family protein
VATGYFRTFVESVCRRYSVCVIVTGYIEGAHMNNLSKLRRTSKQIFNAKFALLFAVALLFGISAGVKAQAQSAESEGARKCRVHEPPEYPALARNNGIKGIARVQVTVQPDGSVSEVKELGGHPLLLDALSRAVKKWKYEKSDKVSVLEVKAGFGT